MNKPKIQKLSLGVDFHDFHDSSLINIEISPMLETVSIIVSTPDEYRIEHLWLIEFIGVLRFEFETLGDGHKSNKNIPIEIYDIYQDSSSAEYKRWVERFNILGFSSKEAKNIKHVILASSFIRGWGDKDYLEGINIICCDISIKPAPLKFKGKEFSRPRIEAK